MPLKLDMDDEGNLLFFDTGDDTGRIPTGLAAMTIRVIAAHRMNNDLPWLADAVREEENRD